jgi:hypothetical protein
MTVERTGFGASVANVAGAIRRAAQATGANFDYLLAAAKVESNLDPNVKATTSSASGLFQFIEQTWLSTMKSAGPSLGYGKYADAIVQTPSGGFAVPDPNMRSAVLNLRNNPTANAAMAGAFTQQNTAELRDKLGRPPSGGELYIAHFLGAAGAAKLVSQASASPSTVAANLFPGAAEANRSIFYDRQGHARSVREVYSALVGRYDTAHATTMAMRAPTPGGAAAVTPVAATSSAEPDNSDAFDSFAMITAVPVAHGAQDGRAFDSLFQTGGRREPISPVVGALWGGSGAPASASEAPAAPSPTSTRAPESAAASAPAPTELMAHMSGQVHAVSAAETDGEMHRLLQDMRNGLRGLFRSVS